MKQAYEVTPVGKIRNGANGTFIELDPCYIPALRALDGFSHLNILWWFDQFDNEQARAILETERPYQKAPETMGIFATRSPVRPNPLALSTVEVLHINPQKGMIQIDFIDANDQSPVLDIKPYTPSMDRVESPEVPEWCGHWPKSREQSGDFDWENEFLFN